MLTFKGWFREFSGSNLTPDALVDGGDDFVGVGDPLERLRVGVVIFEEAVDGGL